MAQNITITATSFAASHDANTTYSLSVLNGTVTPSSGITKAQLESGVNVTTSANVDTVWYATCTADNGSCAGTEAIAQWAPAPTAAPTAAPVTPVTPAPTAAPVTPTPVIDWQSFVGTEILSTVNTACDSTTAVTYWTQGAYGPQKQLYSSNNESSIISTTGYIKIGNSQYNVPNGVLGSAGSCPTTYTHTVYISAPRSSTLALCDADYLISSTKTFSSNFSSFTLSDLKDQQLLEGGSQWFPPATGTNYYGVATTTGTSTRGGSAFAAIEVTDTGLVTAYFPSQTCAPTPAPTTPTPTAAPVIPPPGDNSTVAPVDKGQIA